MATNYYELTTEIKREAKSAITGIAYDTWLSSIEIYSMDENTATILVPSNFMIDQIRPYETLLVNCFKEVTKKIYQINFTSPEELGKKAEIFHATTEQIKSNLDQKFTFNTFVIGGGNKFAQAAAYAVAEAPGSAYNPLFIYGGVGLGKTHLIHAIGNEILRRSPQKKVLYVTAETFTNEFINGIKDNSNEAFRNKYRSIGVLMIDDIQFLAGKDKCQEEFFHTFNTLRENNSQIILTSDRPPKDINPLSDRLKSRFVDGLLVDIGSADYETRLAILRQKVQLENIVIDDIILSNIAAKIDTNIRDLNGTLQKIVAQASLIRSPITFELAEKAIADVTAQKEKIISADYIKEKVAKFYNIDLKDLNSSIRSKEVAHARQVAMYLCRDLAKMQYENIGYAFGKRDHSTVMYACNKIEKELKNNPDQKTLVDSVKNLILQSQSA